MATRYTDEFCRDAVRIATTSRLTLPQAFSDSVVRLSALNKWVQQHPLPDRALHGNVPKANTMNMRHRRFARHSARY